MPSSKKRYDASFCKEADERGCERVRNWENVEWIGKLWEEIPQPTLEQGMIAFSLMIAELEAEV